MKDRLSAEDWIKAAYRALTREGREGLRAEPLARALGVTKGSFYWHFADVPALHRAMLTHWEERATGDIIAASEAGGGSAELRLSYLIEEAFSESDAPYGGRGVETAIRAWAQSERRVAQAVKRVDARREAYLAALFGEAGLSLEVPERAARIFHAAVIGALTLGSADPEIAKSDMTELMRHLIGAKPPAPKGRAA
jgi:AcrR family transcriptional regulator